MINEKVPDTDRIGNSLKRTRYSVFAFYFCQGLIFSNWASRIPDIKGHLLLDDSKWGTMLLMLALGQVIGMSMSGFLVSKFGGKNILLIALPLCLSIMLPISFTTSVYVFIPSLILYGIFSNFLNISVNTQGISIEAMYEGKSIMSSFHGGWSLGGFAGALVGQLMLFLGVIPFYQTILTALLVAIIALFNFKFLPKEIKKQASDGSNEEKKSWKPERFLYILGIVAFCGMFIEGTMFDWSGIYFKDVIQVKPGLVPLGLAGFLGMMATGRFISDKAADKWGRLAVIKVSGSCSFCGLLLAILFPNIIVATLGFMLVGLGTSSVVPMIYSIAGKKTKIPTSIALTVVSSISFLGFLIGPPIIGYIAAATNLRYSFIVGAAFAIIIIILTSRVNVFKKEK